MTSVTLKPDDTLLDIKDVKKIVKFSTASIYRMVKEGAFPAPVKFSHRTVRWIESEVRAWLAEKITAYRTSGAGAA